MNPVFKDGELTKLMIAHVESVIKRIIHNYLWSHPAGGATNSILKKTAIR